MTEYALPQGDTTDDDRAIADHFLWRRDLLRVHDAFTVLSQPTIRDVFDAFREADDKLARFR